METVQHLIQGQEEHLPHDLENTEDYVESENVEQIIMKTSNILIDQHDIETSPKQDESVEQTIRKTSNILVDEQEIETITTPKTNASLSFPENSTDGHDISESTVFMTQSQIDRNDQEENETSYAQVQSEEPEVVSTEQNELEEDFTPVSPSPVDITRMESNDFLEMTDNHFKRGDSDEKPSDESKKSDEEDADYEKINYNNDSANKENIETVMNDDEHVIEETPVIPVRNIENEEWIELLGNKSLRKKITVYGELDAKMGTDVRPHRGQMCTIAYEAYTVADSPMFEADVDKIPVDAKPVEQNESLSFILNDNDVPSALDMCVAVMNKNEQCEMIAESRHLFGKLGRLPDIPANATLHYKINLKDFQDVAELATMNAIERCSLAEAKKLRGNFHFNRQDFHWAIESYKKGLCYFDEENLTGEELPDDLSNFKEMKIAMLMNLALAHYKLEQYQAALEPLNRVIAAQSDHVKGLYIKGKTLMHIGETPEAIICLKTSLNLQPNNQEIKKELVKAQAKHKIQYENEKRMYKKMIDGAGDETKKTKKGGALSSKQSKKTETNSYLSYLAVAGLVAAGSFGLAMLLKYSKNNNLI